MDSVFTCSLYVLTAVLLGISFAKNKGKTLSACKKALKMFINMLPQFVAVLLFAGLALAALSPEMIRGLIGKETGFIGMLISSLAGTVTFVPVMVVFPIAAELLKNGGGTAQIAVFISTLTTVGIITIPIEIKYLGKKVTLLRNLLAFILSFITAYIMEGLIQ